MEPVLCKKKSCSHNRAVADEAQCNCTCSPLALFSSSPPPPPSSCPFFSLLSFFDWTTAYEDHIGLLQLTNGYPDLDEVFGST
ncbi:hypothetical protein VFPPC_16074 [Pochonia chlamydosporia 170]|uniref:Uncharacterized protein n=1 Tax=Pochonia chlamydosporia 170 TaxID=1380566 RepID=A0A179FNT6_METCM|nr:hypothetical protein VFPPC_16074 [Pochonia chlamydosporia 170]OAQ66890.1 hypothetical protein VFPPC_16074 [Pochonia chlamydosporia 170]